MNETTITGDVTGVGLARAWASVGWRCMPLYPEGSVNERGRSRAFQPALNGWPQNASSDVKQVDKLWEGCWNRPVGILTGRDSGFWVLDIDVKNGKDGFERLDWLLLQLGIELPQTFTVRTPSGGKHMYFAYPADIEIRNSASNVLGAGLDTKGRHGMVVAPGTRKRGGFYEVERDGEIVAAPRALEALLEDSRAARRGAGVGLLDVDDVRDAVPVQRLIDDALDVGRGLQEVYLRDAIFNLRVHGTTREQMIEVGCAIVRNFMSDDAAYPWTDDDVVYKVDHTRERVGPLFRLSDAERRYAAQAQNFYATRWTK